MMELPVYPFMKNESVLDCEMGKHKLVHIGYIYHALNVLLQLWAQSNFWFHLISMGHKHI